MPLGRAGGHSDGHTRPPCLDFYSISLPSGASSVPGSPLHVAEVGKDSHKAETQQ